MRENWIGNSASADSGSMPSDVFQMCSTDSEMRGNRTSQPITAYEQYLLSPDTRKVALEDPEAKVH